MSPEADGTNQELERLRQENARLQKMLGEAVTETEVGVGVTLLL